MSVPDLTVWTYPAPAENIADAWSTGKLGEAMSTDYFLVSNQHKKAVMVGSIGLSGIQSFPGDKDVIDFIRWAIDNNITDVVLVNEHNPIMEELT